MRNQDLDSCVSVLGRGIGSSVLWLGSVFYREGVSCSCLEVILRPAPYMGHFHCKKFSEIKFAHVGFGPMCSQSLLDEIRAVLLMYRDMKDLIDREIEESYRFMGSCVHFYSE